MLDLNNPTFVAVMISVAGSLIASLIAAMFVYFVRRIEKRSIIILYTITALASLFLLSTTIGLFIYIKYDLTDFIDYHFKKAPTLVRANLFLALAEATRDTIKDTAKRDKWEDNNLQAIRYYEKALNIYPNHIASYLGMADRYMRVFQNYTKSSDLYKTALGFCSDSNPQEKIKILDYYGYSLLKGCRLQDAQRQFKLAIALGEKENLYHAKAIYNLGLAYDPKIYKDCDMPLTDNVKKQYRIKSDKCLDYAEQYITGSGKQSIKDEAKTICKEDNILPKKDDQGRENKKDEAKKICEEDIKSLRKNDQEEHFKDQPLQAQAYFDLAIISAARNKQKESLDNLSEAIRLNDKFCLWAKYEEKFQQYLTGTSSLDIAFQNTIKNCK